MWSVSVRPSQHARRAGQWEKALTLPHKMRKDGMNANMISFSAAISACEKGGQWQQSSTLLHKMREAGMAALALPYKMSSEMERRDDDDVQMMVRSVISSVGPDDVQMMMMSR